MTSSEPDHQTESNSLQAVRVKIDALDDQLHDLLMQRAELIKEVCAIKRKDNRPIVHPAREASMIRRLLGRHTGILPESAVIGIWRELVGAVSMVQRGLHIYVSGQGDQQFCWDMAKDYCGSVIPMSRCEQSSIALAFLRERYDSLAVLPWPVDGQGNAWWQTLAEQNGLQKKGQDSVMRVLAGLPFGAEVPFQEVENRALVVGRMDYLPSGQDRTFVVVTTQSPLSRARAVDLLKAQGWSAVSVISNTADGAGAAAHLIEIDGYIAPDDPCLGAIESQLEETQQGRCVVIGGYPVPPLLRAGDTKPLELPA